MMEHLIRWVAESIEILAVAIIVGGILFQAWQCLFRREGQESKSLIKDFKDGIGQTMLLGLELLVAADIIQTVILEPTLHNIMALSLLVLVRTFLSWSLDVEIEGRWPWKSKAEGK
jgi:uncharacterized membrane protein